MALQSPPPPAEEPEPDAKPASPLYRVLYAATFLVFAALIFTLAIHPTASPVQAAYVPVPPPPPAPEPPPAPQPPMPKLPLTYPATRTVDASDTFFGTKVPDPYRWLEDGKDPEVIAWAESQNTLTRSYLDALPGRPALQKRYHDLLYIDTISTPLRAGDRFFYMKKSSTQEKAVLYWRSMDLNEPEHVLIDPNNFAASDNASLGGWTPANDGGLLAYTIKPNNADEATLYIMDVSTGKNLEMDVIPGAKYAEPSWLPDGSGFVYTWVPPVTDPAKIQDRPGEALVRFHKTWSDPKNDIVLHPKTGNSQRFVGAQISRDGKWIFYYDQEGWDKTDLYYQPLQGLPTAALAKTWQPLAVGKPFRYSIEAWKDQGYLLTNEGASRFRLFRVDLHDPKRAKWQEIVPESPTIVLQSAEVIGNRLVLDTLENVTSQVEVRELDGKLIRRVALPGPGSIGTINGVPEREEFFYNFVNFTTPQEIFQASVANAEQKLWARNTLPIDTTPYVVEQKFFPSKDGTKVPMFIVHRKDMPFDGTTPFLLTGYGGFALSTTPYFSAGYFPWLEAGGGYALVNLRGGGEFGEKWHQDGMLLKKQNVFDDCIAAAEFLVSQNYTASQRLAFRGASNGGLLAGAMATQRPDLFRAIICEVPLLDMLRYDQFASGKTWVTEYGSAKDKAQFKALQAYSPYHHVKKGETYPSILICSAADDDRVDPLHARKMAAELQAATGSTSPILLRVEAQSGHGGSDQVKKTVVTLTDIWGFLIWELGAQTPGKTGE